MAKIEGDRRVFPEGFDWGTATASFQIEGGKTERGLCIWDEFCEVEGNVDNGDDGSVACDHYGRYQEDVKLLKELGVKSYRFSLSWPRLFPTGEIESESEKGVKFYQNLINLLIENDIKPVVTLYHWDLPLDIEKKYGGWLGEKIPHLFAKYCERCFALFGDRVKMWITLNEPWCSAVMGYCTGDHAPGIDDAPGEKVYLAAHNLLLSHGEAAKIYREKFQKEQGGLLGITINTNWWAPFSKGEQDIQKSHFALAFNLGWFADPLYFGDYPIEMKESLGERLPHFTHEQQVMLRGSTDFLGLNNYTTTKAGYSSVIRQIQNAIDIVRMSPEGLKGTKMAMSMMKNKHHYFKDMDCLIALSDDLGLTDMGWPIVPYGIRHLLEHCQTHYQPKGGIYIFENGIAIKEKTKADAVPDAHRIHFMAMYLSEIHQAMMNGVDLRGFYYWSFMDNFEWACGYAKRFGLLFVDYKTQERTKKSSYHFYNQLVTENALPINKKKDVPLALQPGDIGENYGIEVVNELRKKGVLDEGEGGGKAITKKESRNGFLTTKAMTIFVVFFAVLYYVVNALIFSLF